MTNEDKAIIGLLNKALNEAQESAELHDVYSAVISIEQCRIYLDALIQPLEDAPSITEIEAYARELSLTHKPKERIFIIGSKKPDTCKQCQIFQREPDSFFCEFCAEEGSRQS